MNEEDGKELIKTLKEIEQQLRAFNEKTVPTFLDLSSAFGGEFLDEIRDELKVVNINLSEIRKQIRRMD